MLSMTSSASSMSESGTEGDDNGAGSDVEFKEALALRAASIETLLQEPGDMEELDAEVVELTPGQFAQHVGGLPLSPAQRRYIAEVLEPALLPLVQAVLGSKP